MRRRALTYAATIALVAIATHALAQDRVWRIAVLGLTDSPTFRTVALAELAQLGFMEGRNIVVETRIGGPERLPDLANELVVGRPDVIVATSEWALHAARAATQVIPIVAAPMGADPVVAGVAASWARPGGNVTGVTLIAPELEIKRFELLREAVPAVRRVALLSNHREIVERGLTPLRDASAKAGVELIEFWVDGTSPYRQTFAAMSAVSVDALLIVPTPELNRDTQQLAALAVEAGIATICGFREVAKLGCLIGYGPSLTELHRRVAEYLARILGGAKAGDLPFQAPTHFEFSVNLRTAKALGITMPQSILGQADEVIE